MYLKSLQFVDLCVCNLAIFQVLQIFCEMLISKVKTLVILEVRQLIIGLEFARIRILPNTPNCVMLAVCFS